MIIMELIEKSALVAEIERRIKHYNESAKEFGEEGYNDNVLMEQCKANACKHILSFIDTLEVKEVDLEKEYEEFVEEDPVYNKLVNGIVGKAIAKHFFELGTAQHQNIWHPMSEIIDHPCTILMHGYGNDVWICDAVDKLQQSTAQEWAYIDDVLLLLSPKAQKGE